MHAKTAWRAYYRLMRIARRESAKAIEDLLVFGTGVVRIGDDGTVEHVPVSDLYVSSMGPRKVIVDGFEAP